MPDRRRCSLPGRATISDRDCRRETSNLHRLDVSDVCDQLDGLPRHLGAMRRYRERPPGWLAARWSTAWRLRVAGGGQSARADAARHGQPVTDSIVGAAKCGAET